MVPGRRLGDLPAALRTTDLILDLGFRPPGRGEGPPGGRLVVRCSGSSVDVGLGLSEADRSQVPQVVARDFGPKACAGVVGEAEVDPFPDASVYHLTGDL